MNLDTSIDRLLGALVNGGYQGLVLAMLVWVGLKLIPRTNASTRHAAWLVTLLAVAALPVLHLLAPRSESGADRVLGDSPVATQVGDAAEADGIEQSNFREPTALWTSENRDEVARNEGGVPDSAMMDESANVSGPAVVTRGDSAVDPVPERQTGWVDAVADQVSNSMNIFQHPVDVPSAARRFLAATWLGLVGLNVARLGWQLALMRKLRRESTTVSGSVLDMFSAVAGELGLDRSVQLRLCPGISSPVALGFVQPAILLPTTLLEETDGGQLRQILRHELAHIARRDDWANLVQQSIRAVLFYNPAVLWLTRNLDLEREVACDDHVLAALAAPKEYALLLTDFASRRQGSVLPAALGAWGKTNQLKQRIIMILDAQRNSSTRLTRACVGTFTAITAMLAGLAFVSAPRLALATPAPVVGGAKATG